MTTKTKLLTTVSNIQNRAINTAENLGSNHILINTVGDIMQIVNTVLQLTKDMEYDIKLRILSQQVTEMERSKFCMNISRMVALLDRCDRIMESLN